ncbi:MAG TPA: tetratricopeptide repeat protein [Longimicrobium sp.]|nr:tetratricopeptide repeat protein [Longimicrobium sp.]
MPIIIEPRVRGVLETEAAEDIAVQAAAAERQGEWDTAAGLYARTFRSALQEGWTERAADALRGQARIRQQQGRYEEAEELAELSRELAERNGLAQAVARALNILGIIRYSRQDWAGAESFYRAALEKALDLGDDELVGLACQNLGVLANVKGDLREARSRYLESVGSFVRSGSTFNAMMAYNNLGMAATDLQEWMEAEVYYSRGIEIAERLSHAQLTGMLYSNLAEPLIHVGELQRARDSLAVAEEAATQVGDAATLADISRFRGIIAREQGDLDLAESFLQRALESSGPPDLERAKTLRELARLHRARGRRADAVRAYRSAGALYHAFGAHAYAQAMEDEVRELEEGTEAERR